MSGLTDERIAWIIHEAHRAFQMSDPLHPTHVMPAPPWVTMSPRQKDIVSSLPRLLRRLRLEMSEGEWATGDRVLAEKAHGEWVRQMKADGWAWGESKDPQKRTHPNILAWVRLPAYEQAKTLQAVAIARAHL